MRLKVNRSEPPGPDGNPEAEPGAAEPSQPRRPHLYRITYVKSENFLETMHCLPRKYERKQEELHTFFWIRKLKLGQHKDAIAVIIPFALADSEDAWIEGNSLRGDTILGNKIFRKLDGPTEPMDVFATRTERYSENLQTIQRRKGFSICAGFALTVTKVQGEWYRYMRGNGIDTIF